MRSALGGVPSGQLVPYEEPDICIVADNYRTGVEVTELHQSPESGRGPRRIQESERVGALAQARALAERTGLPVVDVAVHFSESVPIAKSDRGAIAEGLVEVVTASMPAVNSSVVLDLWRNAENSLPWIRTVRLFRADVLTTHHWASPGSGWVQLDFIDELQAAIEDKNARFTTYRRHCDECWLLVVASGSRPSGLFDPSDATRAHSYRSQFARTLFMEAFSGTLVELKTVAA
jgi:hypothetical protein